MFFNDFNIIKITVTEKAKYSIKNNKISFHPVFFIRANHIKASTNSKTNFRETEINECMVSSRGFFCRPLKKTKREMVVAKKNIPEIEGKDQVLKLILKTKITMNQMMFSSASRIKSNSRYFRKFFKFST
ncbi:MAG TPA: hypothetical protein PK064_05580 [Bacteroidales bacterium]|nr:hypothetical protein [Bacteroidales bacterium]